MTNLSVEKKNNMDTIKSIIMVDIRSLVNIQRPVIVNKETTFILAR